jgi:hypothetical protein
MKKTNKVYSASDFASANASVVISDCPWLIDNIGVTKEGSFSGTPLFELELKQLVMDSSSDLPDGYKDGSSEMAPNRTYYVREGRPLYNKLLDIWEGYDGEIEDFRIHVLRDYARTAFRGRVERLTGVVYTKNGRKGNIIQKSQMEAWYPTTFEDGRVLDDFVFMCNRGVYTPVVEETPAVDPMVEAISKIDPKIIEAIRNMK